MSIEILGFSGSPVKNSNTDRLVKAILNGAGVESEFIKLSKMNVRPCLACKKCVPDNICKETDDFPDLAEKIKSAKAIVIGGYTPYGQIDGFTKALLERFWSLRHVNNLLEGKLCATVLTGLMPDVVDSVNQALSNELKEYERMELVGQLSIQGNLPCLTCGQGNDCQMSAVTLMYGTDANTSDIGYSKVESQKDVWDQASQIGQLMGHRLKKNEIMK